ncbi:hypothetical protein FACS1894216_02080 [Synergistales bacterium]|nr:hypothetical protein FACS1894216_02080 [Synergistales bacterium]
MEDTPFEIIGKVTGVRAKQNLNKDILGTSIGGVRLVAIVTPPVRIPKAANLPTVQKPYTTIKYKFIRYCKFICYVIYSMVSFSANY